MLETPVMMQSLADRTQVYWLRGRLRQLTLQFGYPQVRLITHYNDQYRSLSICCVGGALADQQALIAKLAEPLTPKFKAANKSACYEYPDSSDPQINFNNFEDALRWMQEFKGVGANVSATERGWARA